MSWLETVLIYIGVCFVSYQLLLLFRWVYIYFLMARMDFRPLSGSWAVVTGASYGIGYGFAVELAKRRLNLVMIARSKDKMLDIVTDLEKKYKIQTKVIEFDFSSTDLTKYSILEEELKGLQISILVNNVGITTSYPKWFHEMDAQEMQNIAHVNCQSINQMTRIILPSMRERKYGKIIMVSSIGGEWITRPSPLMSIYAATKAYGAKLGQALFDEFEDDGIEVLSVVPFFVRSKMSKMRANFFVCTEPQFASYTLDKLGHNLLCLNPYIVHSIQRLFVNLLSIQPEFVLKFVRRKVVVPTFAAFRNKAKKAYERDHNPSSSPIADKKTQ